MLKFQISRSSNVIRIQLPAFLDARDGLTISITINILQTVRWVDPKKCVNFRYITKRWHFLPSTKTRSELPPPSVRWLIWRHRWPQCPVRLMTSVASAAGGGRPRDNGGRVAGWPVDKARRWRRTQQIGSSFICHRRDGFISPLSRALVASSRVDVRRAWSYFFPSLH